MAFCIYCGKQLADGEACTCEGAKNAPAAEATPASKPIITKEQATEISKGLLAYAKEFFKNPVATSENAVSDNALVTVIGLAAVNAVAALIVGILTLIIYPIRYSYLEYGVGDWLKMIFGTIIWWAALPCALAGLIWLCAKYIEKKEVSFMRALSVFCIPAIPLLALTAIDLLQLLLSHSFFSVIFGFLNAGIGGIMIALTAIGIGKVIPKSDKFLYSIGAICAGLWFANWLINVAIF